MLNVSLVGAGFIGCVHAQCIAANPDTRLAAVHDGEIGKVETMHLTSRTHALPSLDYVKSSGGQLRDKGSHFFDLACWIAGERPVEIHVAGACLIEPRFADYGDVDTAMIILRMASGALCHLDFSRRTAYGCDERIEVSGAEGRVESRHPIPVDVALYRGDVIRRQGLHQHWYDRIEGSYPAQLAAFVEALMGGGNGFPTLVDGLVCEAIAAAGMRSMRENRPVPIRYEFD